MILGKKLGFYDLGVYSRAYGVYMLFEYAFIEGVRPVVLSHLSEANRMQKDFGRIYCDMLAYSTILMVPFFFVMALVSEDVILALYGEQWIESSYILSILCFGGTVLSVTVFFDQLLIASGTPGRAFVYQACSHAIRLAALVLFIPYGLDWAAGAVVLGVMVRAALVVRFANKYYSLSPVVILGSVWKSWVVALIVLGVAFLVDSAMEDVGVVLVRVMGVFLASLMAWLGSVYLFQHPVSNDVSRLWGGCIRSL